MSALIKLTPRLRKVVEGHVDSLFDKLQQKLLGHSGGKNLIISFNKPDSLAGLYATSSKEEGLPPREEIVDNLLRIANSYVDAVRANTKANVVNRVNEFLTDAYKKEGKIDVKEAFESVVSDVFAKATVNVKKIVETESNNLKNMATYDAISRMGAALGEKDPTVFFVIVRDDVTCEECIRLHLMPDGITPRLWKISEIGAGYHKKGDLNPKIGGLHPNCRCQMTLLAQGYGFNKEGKVEYKSPKHNEFEEQRKG